MKAKIFILSTESKFILDMSKTVLEIGKDLGL